MYTVGELKIIASVLKTYNGQCWYSTSLRKKGNVNVIVKAFGSTSFLSDASKTIQKRNNFNPPMLKLLAIAYLRSSRFPITVLHLPIANVKHYFNMKKWWESVMMSWKEISPSVKIYFAFPLRYEKNLVNVHPRRLVITQQR